MRGAERLLALCLVAGLTAGAAGAASPDDAPLEPRLRLFPSAAERLSSPLNDDFPPAEPPEFSLLERRPTWWDRLGNLTQGRVQIEGGYVLTYDRLPGVNVYEHAVPDLLLRVGLTERLEVRIGWPGLLWTRVDGEGTTSQTLDPNVGFMLDLWPQRGWRPQTAVLAAVPVTLQGDPFALDSLQPLTQLLYLWQLSDRWSIGGTTGAALFELDGDRFVEFQQTVSADCLLLPRLGTFVEWNMLVDHGSAEDGSEHMLGGGFSLLVIDRFQATWRVAMGLNPRAPDFLTGIRCAVRF